MRADIPISMTEKELKKKGLKSSTYAVQLEALNDPKRGLLEKPEEGIQGHHEFMLTTDMCLAFTRNDELEKCFKNRDPYKTKDFGGMVAAAHRLECRENFWGARDFTQLFPEDADCCAWIKPKNHYNFGVWSYDDMDTEVKRICNVDITKELIAGETCCQNTANSKVNCGEDYWGAGPAYEDIMEFSRDEDIWLRKYLEAWHHATENGKTKLTYLQPRWLGKRRHDLEDKHAVNCRGLNYYDCRATPECHEVTVGMAPASVQHWHKACRNKHLLVSE